ncbi:FecR domain-containing protein [uncultured Chitinophaga sp.]|uniref:FecR family protein n=1 Tax=uncultured Chitinophaga sp. TaxID=339340 RepID=UPI0025EED1D0|nr:FecR domain-containing protein [uncultured Chitinophaga sp.]
MNYLRHKAEDLVMDESFQQYCSGTNPLAVRFWEQWQQEYPEKKEVVRVARLLYLQLNGGLDAQVFANHHRQFTEAIQAKGIEPGRQAPAAKVIRPNGWKWYAGSVAAALTLLIGSMIWMERGAIDTAAVVDKRPVYASKAGERKSFQLPDGSKVVLNAASTLWLEEGFNSGTRKLTLEGEAFFDVAQNPSAPFVIHTEEMDITVLGTAFNVRAYKEDETNETSLINGRVRVDLRRGRQVYLKPNEKLVINVRKQPEELQTISTKRAATQKAESNYSIAPLTHFPQDSATVELSWVDNRLIFADETFEDIARKLERWYDVKIRFNADELREYRFTGNFNKETLQRVLEVMQLSRGFNFKFEDEKTVVLNP